MKKPQPEPFELTFGTEQHGDITVAIPDDLPLGDADFAMLGISEREFGRVLADAKALLDTRTPGERDCSLFADMTLDGQWEVTLAVNATKPLVVTIDEDGTMSEDEGTTH